MTPREAIRQGTQRLRDAGVPDPVYDAAVLLESVMHRNALALRLDTDHPLTMLQLEAYEGLLARRAARIPLQHLLGSAWFCGRPFRVNGDVLIPRPETELLAERALDCLKELPEPVSVLDLCTGSGCIAVTLALETGRPGRVLASDLSPAALAVAEENARTLGAEGIRFLQGDLFGAVPPAERFGVIVSNPPYIPTEACAGLQPEVLHDPLLALDGGADGLSVLRRIIREAPEHLAEGGWLLLEIGSPQAEDVCGLIRAAGAYAEPAVRRDQAGLDRMVEARRLART